MEYDDDLTELFDLNLDANRRNRQIQAFWPDAQRLDDLTNYNAADWDTTRLPVEARGALPKEWADGRR